jgi:hypothetical protein
MPIQLTEESGGNVLAIRASGKLVKPDYELLVPAFERHVRAHGKVRLLFDMTGFEGWSAGAAWEDFKLGVEHYADIERLAILGERKWHHAMATFCGPLTKAAVRYFDHTDAAAARAWLNEA